MNKSEIENAFNSLSEKKNINGKSFDEIFQIEGVTLWWFFRRFFVEYVMPKPINTFDWIYKNKRMSSKEKIKLAVNANLLKKYILVNEKKKIRYFKKNKEHQNKKSILFLSYTNHISPDGNIFRIQNIVNKIKADKKFRELVLFVDPLSSKSYKRLLGHCNIYSYYDKRISEKAKIISKKIFGEWGKIDEKTKHNMIKTSNASLWPYLKYSFSFFMSQEFLYFLILYYELFKKIIKNENVKAVVLTSVCGLFDKCLIAAAKNQNIKPIVIQHGLYGFTVNPDIITETKFMIFNNFYKKSLLGYGIKEKDIIITGPVIYDGAKKYMGKQKRNKGINILIATTAFVEEGFLDKKTYQRYLIKIFQDIEKIKDISVVIKLHPIEKKIKFYKNLAKKYKDIKIIQNQDRNLFYRLIADCDVFLNFGSSSLIEAMIFHKPVINMDLLKRNQYFTKESKATIEVSLDDDVGKAILKAIKKKGVLKLKERDYVKKMCGKIDGNSYKEAVKQIYGLLS